MRKTRRKRIFFSSQHLICSHQGSSGSVDLGTGARCFPSLGVWRLDFGSVVKNRVCEELQVKYDRACAYSGSWARWQSSCVERVLCSGASAGSAPRVRSDRDIHWGSIWQPRLYIYIVWGYMFYMPVLSVIGQTFTL